MLSLSGIEVSNYEQAGGKEKVHDIDFFKHFGDELASSFDSQFLL